ncbi:MAG TPA: non-homologous end-joining DNA ligase [Acidimicrobiales bacterium]|nr:non-homologous end-joining DNA ligase [Acidimicrobiales bacterium]
MTDTRVAVDGRELSLSNLDKVLYPDVGFTKGQVISYYQRIASALLPHLDGRPLTLKRYPNGVDDKFFYEKRCPSHRPDWVTTAPILVGSKGEVPFCVVDSLPTLVWVANLASLELHTSLSLADPIERPTMVVFDLDPGPGTDLVQCGQVALWLRGVLEDHLGLTCFAKTSGSKGMQIYAPLNTPVTYEGGTKDFALAMARLGERQLPDLVVSAMKKELRKDKVFIDWSQNDQHKTTVCVYSLRARPRPTVSMPVTWDEVEDMTAAGDATRLVFEADDAVARVEEIGDLFAPMHTLVQELPKL